MLDFNEIVDNWYGKIPQMKALHQTGQLSQEDKYIYFDLIIDEMRVICSKILGDKKLAKVSESTIFFIFEHLSPQCYSHFGKEQFDPVNYNNALEWLQYRVHVEERLMRLYNKKLISFNQLVTITVI